jgi:small neutral amino acid transporter SnatA (MarC family)
MHQFPAGSLLTDLLISYMTLLSIINPFGLAFVFYARTRALPEPARIAVARNTGKTAGTDALFSCAGSGKSDSSYV